MRKREQEIGTRNLVGAKVERLRQKAGMRQKELLAQLQVRGVSINASALSKLEGQVRTVTDYELVAIADVFGLTVDELLAE
ncbi:MAG: helix-turn-helix domain-containing protein [Candidatus Fimenecus sp.]|nr:helix-turn-helix transcriptional regulator [Clostridia bacterium]